jgi:hypothetical protein
MKFYALIVAVLLIVSGCTKEQPELTSGTENCNCATEVSAKFLMEELATPINFSGFRKQTDTDTIYAGRNVRFYGLEANAGYTWYIGSEVITDREFYRFFDASLIGQTLDMILVVDKEPNLICYPSDDGYDSIVRQLTVVEEPTEFDFHAATHPRFEGTFRVKDLNSSDSIDIVCEIADNTQTYKYKVTNYDGLGTEHTFQWSGFNYRQRWISGTCYTGHVLSEWDGEFELLLNANSLSSCTTYHYRGRRLN